MQAGEVPLALYEQIQEFAFNEVMGIDSNEADREGIKVPAGGILKLDAISG